MNPPSGEKTVAGKKTVAGGNRGRIGRREAKPPQAENSGPLFAPDPCDSFDLFDFFNLFDSFDFLLIFAEAGRPDLAWIRGRPPVISDFLIFGLGPILT